MSFFSRGNYGGGNRGRGNRDRRPNDFWQRGNKRLRFSIHFDVDSKEFNQLLQTGFLNLAGQRVFRPPPSPERSPVHPHPSISNIPVQPHVSLPPKAPVNDSIPVQPHVSLPPEAPVNDSWNDVVHPPQTHFDGWPTVSFPLPPPLKQPAEHIASVTSHAHSTQPLKRLESISQDPEPSKEKQLANSA